MGRGKRRFPIPNKKYRDWEKAALVHVRQQWGLLRDDPIDGWVHVRAAFFLPTARLSDLSNLLEAPADLLEKAGVITNDKNIVSWDGSRRYIDRDNPRIELWIRETDESGYHPRD